MEAGPPCGVRSEVRERKMGKSLGSETVMIWEGYSGVILFP